MKNLNQKMKKNNLLLLAILAFVVTVPVSAQDANIRVIHLSPDAPAVDVYVNQSIEAFSDLGFPDGTVYANLAPGTYDFDVVPAGGTPPFDTVLFIDDLALAADTNYTAVAYDELSSISPLALVDDNSDPGMDTIRLRAIHTAYMVGEVDIWVIPGMGSPSILWEDLDFGEVGAYLDVPAAAYKLGFDVNNDAVPDVIFDVPALPEGTVANVFAVQESDGTLFLNAQLQDSSVVRIDLTPDPAQLRAIHLSPNAPAVDIWVDGSLVAVNDLAFPDGTDYLQLEPGTYTFDIVPAGGDIGDSVLTIPDLMLETGMDYTAAAYDEVASISALALGDDNSDPGMDTIRLRAIHTAYMVGEVDIWVIPGMGSPSILWEDLDFGEVGAYLDVPAVAYKLGFDVDNDAVPDVFFDVPALPEGTVANVFAVQESDGTLFLNAQLQDSSVVRIDLSPAKLRAIHLSPDAPAVDIWVDGSLVAVNNLAFPDGTVYLDLAPGMYTFDIVPAGGDIGDSVLTIPDLALESGEYYTAAAYNTLASISALALSDDYDGLAHGNIRLRSIHTAVGVGEVDIWLIPDSGSPSILWENVAFGATGAYLDVPSAPYLLGFDIDNDAVPDVTFNVPQLPSGTVANVFAVTDNMGDLFLNAQLNDGSTAKIPANTCTTFGVDVYSNTAYVSPGDSFYVKADICNPGTEMMDMPFFGILDVGSGDYWFYPSWVMTPDIDYIILDISNGVTTVDILPQFVWPETGNQSLADVHIFGAVLNQELTEIVGVFDALAFGFGPAQ